MKDKRKRDFEIRLLKGELEKRKTYPRGVPPGPSPEELREQRERDAEKARKDAEHRLKCKQEAENTPLMLYQRESRAKLAIDRDYYRKLEAAKSPPPPEAYGRIVLTPEEQQKSGRHWIGPRLMGAQSTSFRSRSSKTFSTTGSDRPILVVNIDTDIG